MSSTFDHELEETNEPCDNEDLQSAAHLTSDTVRTLCTAFQQRFPVLDGRAVYIITHSCMLTALNVLLSMEEDVAREMAKEAMFDLFNKIYAMEDLRKHQL